MSEPHKGLEAALNTLTTSTQYTPPESYAMDTDAH